MKPNLSSLLSCPPTNLNPMEQLTMPARSTLYVRHDSWRMFKATMKNPATNHSHASFYFEVRPECGTITYSANRTLFEIQHSMGSGNWKLVRGSVILSADKPSCVRRQIDFSVGAARKYVLRSRKRGGNHFELYLVADGVSSNQTTKGRIYRKRDLGAKIAEFTPDRWFKGGVRGYTIQFDSAIPEHLIEFSYWLINMFKMRGP